MRLRPVRSLSCLFAPQRERGRNRELRFNGVLFASTHGRLVFILKRLIHTCDVRINNHYTNTMRYIIQYSDVLRGTTHTHKQTHSIKNGFSISFSAQTSALPRSSLSHALSPSPWPHNCSSSMSRGAVSIVENREIHESVSTTTRIGSVVTNTREIFPSRSESV